MITYSTISLIPYHHFLPFFIGVISDGGLWHKSCFTCGALSSLGCKRVLLYPIVPDYFHHFGCPFCHGCTNKLFQNGNLKYNPNLFTKKMKKMDKKIENFSDNNDGNYNENENEN